MTCSCPTVEALLKSACSKDIARLDAEVLLAAVLNCDRSWVLAHSNKEVDEGEAATFMKDVERRRVGEPVAYIIGVKEFYGRPFTVDERVLIPRPATEGLCEAVLHALLEGLDAGCDLVQDIDTEIVAWTHAFEDTRDVSCVCDIGTGSGCIAVTLARECPDLRVVATDTSEEALQAAHSNAKRLGVEDRMTFLVGEGVEPLSDLCEPFLIVSNPPYIPEGEELLRDVQDYEPRGALFAGPDGTDVLRALHEGASGHPFCKGFLFECRKNQAISLSRGVAIR